MTNTDVTNTDGTDTASSDGFVPPPYPYDRLDRFKPLADDFAGGLIDFSIGTPFDSPPPVVTAAFSNSKLERGYPKSIGNDSFRGAASEWLSRRFQLDVPTAIIAATVGSKEFVATLPQWMQLRHPTRDTVLYPATSYPSYAMGAILAGCRAVPVRETAAGDLDYASIDPGDINRALLLWVNSPTNPTGKVCDLAAAAEWGRKSRVPVFSDECYIEFTWDQPGRSILEHGTNGVVAVHSLSKRSNLAGARVGFYAGDADIVHYLSEVRKHAGMMVPGPSQAAAAVALAEDAHVDLQRGRYRSRLEKMAYLLERWTGTECPLPEGGFYLWLHVGDAWAFTERLARDGGALVTPGEFFGSDAAEYVRVAVVQPDEKIDQLEQRLLSR